MSNHPKTGRTKPVVEIEKNTSARRLLLESPDDISEIFRDEVWRLWGLLIEMEREALEVLKLQPVKTLKDSAPVAQIFSLREQIAMDLNGASVIDWGEENQLTAYSSLPGLNPNQRNAIEVLLSVWRIRAFMVGAGQIDVGVQWATARSLCEKIALEMMILCFASFRGDFRTKLQPHIESSLIAEDVRLTQARENQLKAVATAAEILRLAKKHKKKSCNDTIKKVREHWVGGKPPAYGTCFRIVQPLFRQKSQT